LPSRGLSEQEVRHGWKLELSMDAAAFRIPVLNWE